MDFNNITIATLIEMEDHGVTLDQVRQAGADFDAGRLPSVRVIAATAFLQAREATPEISWEDAVNRTLGDVTATLSTLDLQAADSPE